MTKRILFFLMTSVLVLAGASNASAQASLTTSTPSWELSAGYQFFHLPELDFPLGFGLDGAMHFGNFGLVAEGGWARHAEGEDEGGLTDFEFTTNIWPRRRPAVHRFQQTTALALRAGPGRRGHRA